jgi:hypothetical protein
VVGSNVAAFVENIYAAYGYHGRIGYYLLTGFQYFLFLLLVSQTAIFAMRGTVPFMDTLVGVQQIPFGIVISFLLIPLMRFAIARQHVLLTVAFPVGFVLLYFAARDVMHRFFEGTPWAEFYFDGEVGFITSWQTLLLWIVLFIAATTGKWLLRRYALNNVRGS